jgi:hypothetical protein
MEIGNLLKADLEDETGLGHRQYPHQYIVLHLRRPYCGYLPKSHALIELDCPDCVLVLIVGQLDPDSVQVEGDRQR